MSLYIYTPTERDLIEMSEKKKSKRVASILRTKRGCLQQPKALKMAEEQDILGSNTSLFPVSAGRSIPL